MDIVHFYRLPQVRLYLWADQVGDLYKSCFLRGAGFSGGVMHSPPPTLLPPVWVKEHVGAGFSI